MVDTRALRAREVILREGSSPSPDTLRSVAQMAERLVWDEEAPGSSPGTPT
jgi:hypothetical protein